MTRVGAVIVGRIAFDESKNDDSFYVPPETFKNADSSGG